LALEALAIQVAPIQFSYQLHQRVAVRVVATEQLLEILAGQVEVQEEQMLAGLMEIHLALLHHKEITVVLV
jgi:hypothetical protein